jgi:tRNA A37 methylthiotransferase MiaB
MENEKKLDIKFITGEFSQELAMELLLNVIAKKIQFHSIGSISYWEKNATEDVHSKNRLEELKSARKEILQLLKKAHSKDQKIKIQSNIFIELLD